MVMRPPSVDLRPATVPPLPDPPVSTVLLPLLGHGRSHHLPPPLRPTIYDHKYPLFSPNAKPPSFIHTTKGMESMTTSNPPDPPDPPPLPETTSPCRASPLRRRLLTTGITDRRSPMISDGPYNQILIPNFILGLNPVNPPIPPIPPDPPPWTLFLLLSASEDLTTSTGLSPSPTSDLSPALHLDKPTLGLCLAVNSLPELPKLPHSISQVWFLRISPPTYMVLESQISSCVSVFATYLVSVRILTAICRLWFVNTLTISSSVLDLKSKSVWRLVLVIDIVCLKDVLIRITKLPHTEDVTELPLVECVIELSCLQVVELPCFEDYANSLASSGFLCFALFGICRSLQGQKTTPTAIINAQQWATVTRYAFNKSKPHLQFQPQVYQGGPGWCYSDPDKSFLSKDSTTRRHLSSLLIVECLVVQSALLAAHSPGYQHLIVLSDSLSLVTLSRSVINELKSVFRDIYCLGDNPLYLSFFYVPRVENHEADKVAKSALCNLVSFSCFGA